MFTVNSINILSSFIILFLCLLFYVACIANDKRGEKVNCIE